MCIIRASGLSENSCWSPVRARASPAQPLGGRFGRGAPPPSEDPSGGGTFWELVVPASGETSEGLTNFLWERGALGVVEEEALGGTARLRAFFSDTADPDVLTVAISDYLSGLRALGFLAPGEPTVTRLLEEAWAEAWRQTFVPRAVGRRLLIAPPWEIPPLNDGQRLVVIEPGRAFGTGNHASTLGCLTLLESSRNSRPVAGALDIGTGTGILAIAAAVLGIPTVTALDTDPDAIAAARGNVERNGLGGRIDCRLEGPEDFQGPPVPLILANLLAGSHVALGAHYRRLSASGAHLILGGILAEERQGVRDAMASHGFVPLETLEQDGWVSLLLTKGQPVWGGRPTFGGYPDSPGARPEGGRGDRLGARPGAGVASARVPAPDR